MFPARQLLNQIWRWLTEPADAIQDPEQRLRAQTLAGMLLLSAPITLVGAVYGYAGLYSVLALMILAYLISRTRYFVISAFLILTALTVPSYIQVIIEGSYQMEMVAFRFAWTIIPLLMGSVVLPSPGPYIFAAINLVGVLLFAIIDPQLSLLGVSAALGLLVMVTTLMVLSTYFREQYFLERTQVEEQLKVSLKEKEVLLKEIHHRVKNNLQVVSSLLNLQAGRVTDQDAKVFLQDSRKRIESIALVHQLLYNSQDLSRIDFGVYIRAISNQLSQAYEGVAERTHFRINVDGIMLPVDIAVPCGLLVTELITNALKHAFPEGRAGTVYVVFVADDKGQLRLTVRDDGVGFPEGLDIQQATTLGLSLIEGLVRQLGGTLELNRDQGTSITVSFSASGESV